MEGCLYVEGDGVGGTAGVGEAMSAGRGGGDGQRLRNRSLGEPPGSPRRSCGGGVSLLDGGGSA